MKLDYFPRVLIITVNPLSSTSNNGKTYASFFKEYPKDCISQLYFHREIPTSDVCENYYKISDEDIITKFFGKSKSMGKKVCMCDKEERVISETLINRIKKSSGVRFIRSLLWSFINIENEDLKKWLKDFNPQIIFFCGGDANYLYNKVIKISKRFNAKIVYYITDDYVLPYLSINPIYLLNRYWTKNVFMKMCKNSSLILTIGDKMTRVYNKKFGVESQKIMNLVNVETNNIQDINLKKNGLKFVYTGGLHSNRWKTLALIGKSFERLNKRGIKANLEIYSQNKPENKVLKEINNKEYSQYCGSLDEFGVKRVLKEADVLVHVESFNHYSKRVTYLSISTKIPEYMAMGKCILAMGPSDVASMEYIKETKSGYVITSTENEKIDEILKEIILNPNSRSKYIEEALSIVKENHDIIKIRNEFQLNLKNL